MQKRSIIAGATAAFALVGAANADYFIYDAGSHYYSESDSPIVGEYGATSGYTYFLENFEDGLLNQTGVTADAGVAWSADHNTDSVDFDDGAMDGSGLTGTSWFVANPDGASVTFTFDAEALGQLPTVAGIVWTDGKDTDITITAWDAEGNLIGNQTEGMTDAGPQGGTDADRYFGVEFDGGISAFMITAALGSIELDHLQYGFARVVPLPAPLAMGALGLAGVIVARRRRKLG